MLRFLLFFFIVTANFYIVNAQVNDSISIESSIIDSLKQDTIVSEDSLMNDTIEITEMDTLTKLSPAINDTLMLSLDSVKTQNSLDTLKGIIEVSDSVDSAVQADTLITLTDTIDDSDSLFIPKTYEELLSELRDSLIFEEADTIHYVIYNLENLISTDSLILNDTTKQAIQKLIDYTTSQKIDTVIDYLRNNIKFSLDTGYQDSILNVHRDSIFKAVNYLIDRIPEDSIKLSFTNLNNDSILFKSAEDEVDSVRLNIYDNRGEYGTLWIIKTQVDVFDIYLEDGIYIEKAKQRKVVDQKLDTDFKLPRLRKVDKVSKIIPIWTFDGLADIKFSQGFISDSWSEGGESSISALSVLKYSADYSYGKLRSFDTDFEYRLGYIQAGDKDLRKNDDKFEINAKYGRSAFNDWYYSALLNFKTQLLNGYEYPNDSTETNISQFLSPAYLVFSLGLDYKPSSKLTILISPLTSKYTIVADTVRFDQTRFGVGQNEQVRKEIGAYVKAISKIKFRDNMNLENKINFFTNYTNNPQNIDVDWEVNLKIKLTDYINMSLNAHFIYDDDVKFIEKDGEERGARAQFKELLGVGFVYSF